MLDRVISIGSCRIGTPLAMVRDRCGFRLNDCQPFGFVHTSSEALQQIRWMRGELEIPIEIWPFVSNRESDLSTGSGFDCDAVVVEIGNVHPVSFDGYAIQLNRMSEQFGDFRELWDIWRKYPARKQLALRQPLLAANASFERLDPVRRALLERAVMQAQTVDALTADLEAIRDLTPANLLFVTHCSAGPDHPVSMRSRDRAIALVKEACARDDLAVFDPTPHLAEFGVENGLAEQGSDIQHYSPPFAELIGMKIVSMLWPDRRPEAVAAAIGPEILLSRELKRCRVEVEPERVIALARELLLLRPHSHLAWQMSARAYTIVGRRDVSEMAWDRVLKLEPNVAGLWLEATSAAVKFRAHERAAQLAARAIALGAVVPPTTAAQIAAGADDVDAALGHLGPVLAANPNAAIEIIEAEDGPTRMAAVACLAGEAAPGGEGLAGRRDRLFDAAWRRSVDRRDAGDVDGEVEALRVARILTRDRPDLHRRLVEMVTEAGAADPAIASAGWSASKRRSTLYGLDGLPIEMVLAGAEISLADGRIEDAAAVFRRLLAGGEAVDAVVDTVTDRAETAIGRGDAAVATRLLALVADRAQDHPRVIRARRVLHGINVAAMLGASAAAAVPPARAVLGFDGNDRRALRVIGFAGDRLVEPAERSAALRRLVALEPRAAADIGAAIDEALADWRYETASDYFAVAEAIGIAGDQRAAWRAKILSRRIRELREGYKTDSDAVAPLAARVFEYDPENPMALWLSARNHLRRHSWDLARPYLERLVSVEPDNVDARDLLDKCLARCGKVAAKV